eukprot:g976.t1
MAASIFASLRQQLYDTRAVDVSHVEEALDMAGGDLTPHDLDTVLRYCGLFVSKQDIGVIYREIGSGSGGPGSSLSKDAFLGELAPAMNERRQRVVQRAFGTMAASPGDEEVSLDAFWARVDLARHPACRNMPAKVPQAEEKCRAMCGDSGDGGGTLSWPQFGRFITGMSATVPVDDVFVDAIAGMFQVDEREESDEGKVSAIVEALREKVRQRIGGRRAAMHPGLCLRNKLMFYDGEGGGTLAYPGECWAAFGHFGVGRDPRHSSSKCADVDAAFLGLFGGEGGNSVSIAAIVKYMYPDFDGVVDA